MIHPRAKFWNSNGTRLATQCEMLAEKEIQPWTSSRAWDRWVVRGELMVLSCQSCTLRTDAYAQTH